MLTSVPSAATPTVPQVQVYARLAKVVPTPPQPTTSSSSSGDSPASPDSLLIKAFWDYTEKRQLGTTKAEWSVTSEWSPDGCYFMTATTAPRLQVDNGIKIFHHNGSLYFKKMFDKLYQAEWKPESPDRFGDIAELVKSVDSLKVGENKIQGQGSKSSNTSAKSSNTSAKSTSVNPPTQKPAAYRPPHAKTAEAIQAELFGRAPTQEMSKNALKNMKKREKQKEKKAAEAATSGS